MPPTEHPAATASRGHEQNDVNVRGILWFIVIFVITGAVMTWLLWIVYGQILAHEARRDEPTSALAAERPPPPEPQLQPFGGHGLPHQDMAALRASENVRFAQRGWIDQETGAVRVPDAILDRVASARMAAATSPTTQSGQPK